MNNVSLVGNIVREIELRYLHNGGAVATTGIATNKKYKKQDGTQGEEVMFIDIVFFGRTAEVANQYLQKGSKVGVTGSLKLDQWTDQSGVKRSKHSVKVEAIEMIGKKEQSEPKVSVNHNPEPKYTQQEMPEIDIDESEIPF